MDVHLSLAQLTNGFEITFDHIGQYIVVARSEPNMHIKNGDIFKIRNEGMPNQLQPHGDLYLQFHDKEGATICGNQISLTSALPCEIGKIKHVMAEKVDKIPQYEDFADCAQQ